MTKNNTEFTRKLSIATTIVWSVIIANTALADLIFYQGFDYGDTDGDLATVASADWITDTSVKSKYKSTGLTHEGSFSTGGSVQTVTTWGTSTTIQDFDDISLIDKDEFWFSMLISNETASPGGGKSFSVCLSTTQDGSTRNYYVGKTYHNTTAFGFGTLSYTFTDLNGAEFTTIGTDTIRIVYKIRTGAVPEVWVNPVTTPVSGTGQQIGTAAMSSFTSIDSITISSLGIAVNVDEFVIGETYADVTAPVPPEGSVFVIE